MAQYACRLGEMLTATSETGGGSIGEKTTDVSKGHAVCSRDDCGSTEPGPIPTKSIPQTAREFERAMRELGFSKRQAKAIANSGFKGLAVEDSSEDVSELAALIERNSKLFERIERQLP